MLCSFVAHGVTLYVVPTEFTSDLLTGKMNLYGNTVYSFASSVVVNNIGYFSNVSQGVYQLQLMRPAGSFVYTLGVPSGNAYLDAYSLWTTAPTNPVPTSPTGFATTNWVIAYYYLKSNPSNFISSYRTQWDYQSVTNPPWQWGSQNLSNWSKFPTNVLADKAGQTNIYATNLVGLVAGTNILFVTNGHSLVIHGTSTGGGSITAATNDLSTVLKARMDDGTNDLTGTFVNRINTATNDVATRTGNSTNDLSSVLRSRMDSGTNDLSSVIVSRITTATNDVATRTGNATNDLSTVLKSRMDSGTNDLSGVLKVYADSKTNVNLAGWAGISTNSPVPITAALATSAVAVNNAAEGVGVYGTAGDLQLHATVGIVKVDVPFTVNSDVATTGSFNGNGSGISNLNASQLLSGTIPDGRLAATNSYSVGGILTYDTSGNRVWTNVASGLSIGNKAATASVATNLLGPTNYIAGNVGMAGTLKVTGLVTASAGLTVPNGQNIGGGTTSFAPYSGGLEFNCALYPHSNAKYPLGDSGSRWTTIWITNLDCSINGTFGGTLTTMNGAASNSRRLLAPVSITVSSTPFTFYNSYTNGVNNTGGTNNIYVFVDGSGVTGSVALNGTTIFSALTGADATVPLQPGEYVTVTYSIGTPVMTWKPF